MHYKSIGAIVIKNAKKGDEGMYYIEVIVLLLIGFYGLAQAFMNNKVARNSKGQEKSTKYFKVSGALMAVISWLLAGYIIYHYLAV